MILICFGVLAWLSALVLVIGVWGLVAEGDAKDRSAAAESARRRREDASGGRPPGRPISARPAVR